MDHLDDLVDLYEYRVEDLLQGRTPKGGKQALLRLRQLLIQSRLPGPLAKRFRQADARFRAQRRDWMRSWRSLRRACFPPLGVRPWRRSSTRYS